jgi:hypothetical protein
MASSSRKHALKCTSSDARSDAFSLHGCHPLLPKLAPISQDACAFHEDHAVILEEAGAVAVYEQLAASQPEMFEQGVDPGFRRDDGAYSEMTGLPPA